MSKENDIPVEEDVQPEQEGESQEHIWWDELKVTGDELLETVRRLVSEASVRKIVVKNRNERTLIEIPYLAGLAGITLLPTYAALALIAGLVTDCSILVERKVQVEEPVAEEA